MKPNLILLGAPGSGKGTRAVAICEILGIPQVATGDLFRKNLSEGTELGELAKGYISRGELVPDEITAKMLKDRISMPDTKKGFVLDGFPRNLAQAEILEKMLGELGEEISKVIYLEVDDEEIINRLSKRLVCEKCGAPYHLEFTPPSVPNVCDKCGGRLFTRDDDNPETIRNRLDIFHSQTEPLIEFYKSKGVLFTLKSEISGKGILEDMREMLKSLELV